MSVMYGSIQKLTTHMHAIAVQVYVHGGVSVATGHGCINDLWTFDMDTGKWSAVPVATVCASASTKLAAARVTSIAACQHTLAVDSAGTLLLFGGNMRGGELNKKMQALLPLVSNVPGGPPANFPAVTRVRPAGTLAALALCRCCSWPRLDTLSSYSNPLLCCSSHCMDGCIADLIDLISCWLLVHTHQTIKGHGCNVY
jgi:hypothetical protein